MKFQPHFLHIGDDNCHIFSFLLLFNCGACVRDAQSCRSDSPGLKFSPKDPTSVLAEGADGIPTVPHLEGGRRAATAH